MKKAAKPAAAIESPAKQLAAFIDKFDPAMAKRIRAARQAMRKRLPTPIEMVYDNYNFLAIGYGATERPSDAIFSLASNCKGVGLCFVYGAKLPDPHKILQGSGNQTRFIRLESAATLVQPEVEELLHAAIAQAKVALPPTGGGHTVIKSISAKQRPRRLAS
jgi:hypothetical protein